MSLTAYSLVDWCKYGRTENNLDFFMHWNCLDTEDIECFTSFQGLSIKGKESLSFVQKLLYASGY